MAVTPQIKANQLAKDLNVKSKDMIDLMAQKGIELKAQKALEPYEFEVLFDAITAMHQIDGIDDYIDGVTFIPSKLEKVKKPEKAEEKAEEKVEAAESKVEEKVEIKTEKKHKTFSAAKTISATPLNRIEVSSRMRFSTGLEEFDRVLGGRLGRRLGGLCLDVAAFVRYVV